jgi:hypothetical protein
MNTHNGKEKGGGEGGGKRYEKGLKILLIL